MRKYELSLATWTVFVEVIMTVTFDNSAQV